MRFKLDENFGTRTLEIFRAQGHGAHTVPAEHLSGCADPQLFQAYQTERRGLVTLDFDFYDVTRFPPARSHGIVVIRGPRNPSRAILERLVEQFLDELKRTTLNQNLWIVEIGRIGIHSDQ